MTALDVDGWTVADPVPDEDWEDVVRWEVNYWWHERRDHDRDGYLCEVAGSEKCLALGHRPDDDGEWDPDDHPIGWNGDTICPATRYASACSQCESEDCGGWNPFDPSVLWAAVAA